jgi:ABC-type glutathione transport system ATPase component
LRFEADGIVIATTTDAPQRAAPVDASAASVATLRLVGIKKSYAVGKPGEVEVLHGIDLVLDRGEFVALIGSI